MFKIIQLNINSLHSRQKRHFLDEFLKGQRPEVVLLCETRLDVRDRVSFNNYSFVCKDKPGDSLSGGTGILIHSIENLNSLEATAVKIKTDSWSVLYIVSTYLNPRFQFSATDFNKVFGLPTADDKIIVGGDLNAKHQLWYSGLNSNSTGNALFKWYLSEYSRLNIHIERTLFPTDHKHPVHSFLDIFLISND